MTDTDEPVVLLSLRPRFAEAILAGHKTAELRRVAPTLQPGGRIVLYASGPVRAVVGTARVIETEQGTPEAIWHRAGEHAQVSRDEYDAYFHSAPSASALWITGPVRLDNPIPLDHLRRHERFQPPQNYRYLSWSDIERLAGDHAGYEELRARVAVRDCWRSPSSGDLASARHPWTLVRLVVQPATKVAGGLRSAVQTRRRSPTMYVRGD